MKCPVCKNVRLQTTEPESGPVALACEQCHGRWIRSFHYWQWRDRHGRSLPEAPGHDESQAVGADTTSAKLCPECGHILIRYPVGHGVSFQLDRCGHCGGTWFDAGEWDALEDRNLHDDVHLIFSTVWQHAVRDEERRQSMEQLRAKMFGDEDYARMKEIKAWIANHPEKALVRAFILDEG